MEITVEISYYPLDEKFEQPVLDFIELLQQESNVKVEPGHMSTIIAGEYSDVMMLLTESIRPFMEKMPSVFAMRITNACRTCKR